MLERIFSTKSRTMFRITVECETLVVSAGLGARHRTGVVSLAATDSVRTLGRQPTEIVRREMINRVRRLVTKSQVRRSLALSSLLPSYLHLLPTSSLRILLNVPRVVLV